MPDRQYLADPIARTKRPWFLLILCVIVLACVSCNDAAHQTSQPRGAPTRTTRWQLPLTDSAPPQGDMTPTVPALTPQSVGTTTPTTQPSSLIAGTSYEAELPQNTLADGAAVIGCTNDAGCSGGHRVGHIGLNSHPYNTDGTLQFNNIYKSSGGQYILTIYYIIAGSDKLTMYISVNDGSEVVLNVADTANRGTIGTTSITANLNAGNNTIEFSNPSDPAPDIDRIVV